MITKDDSKQVEQIGKIQSMINHLPEEKEVGNGNAS